MEDRWTNVYRICPQELDRGKDGDIHISVTGIYCGLIGAQLFARAIASFSPVLTEANQVGVCWVAGVRDSAWAVTEHTCA